MLNPCLLVQDVGLMDQTPAARDDAGPERHDDAVCEVALYSPPSPAGERYLHPDKHAMALTYDTGSASAAQGSQSGRKLQYHSVPNGFCTITHLLWSVIQLHSSQPHLRG